MPDTNRIGTLIPAYGADYKSAKEVQAAWNAGKDFEITSMFHPDCGRVCNKQDLSGFKPLIRYKKLSAIMQIK